MLIKDSIIKHYLSNVYFVVGTAYAGKSTMCKLLAQQYDLIHCEENYNSNTIFSIVDSNFPNLNYFNSKESWQAYLSRSPQVFNEWIDGVDQELMMFEIAELISLSKDKKVIVDSNIPIDYLLKICDYNQVLVMLSEPEISSEVFFQREDAEKLFLLDQIHKSDDPKSLLKNFKDCIKLVNQSRYQKYKDSGFFTIERLHGDWASKEDTLSIISKHFNL